MYGMNGLNSFQGGFSPGIQDIEQAFLQSNAAPSLPGMGQQTEVDEMESGVGGQDKMMEFMKMMSQSGDGDSVAGNMAKLAMMFI